MREQLWAQQQEAKGLRDKAEGQRKALEERRADVSGLKVGFVVQTEAAEGDGGYVCRG